VDFNHESWFAPQMKYLPENHQHMYTVAKLIILINNLIFTLLYIFSPRHAKLEQFPACSHNYNLTHVKMVHQDLGVKAREKDVPPKTIYNENETGG